MAMKRIQAERLNIEEIHTRDFIKEEKPIVIENGCKNWSASAKWNIEFFKKKYGKINVPLSNYQKDPYQAAETKTEISISEYLSEVEKILSGQDSEQKDNYSAGWYFTKGHRELLKDIDIPNPFKDNWAEKVQKVLYFDTTSLLFGHPHVESPLHTDSFFVSTWFACVRGSKRIRLIEPKYSQFVCNGFNVFDQKNEDILSQKGVPIFEATVNEGDIVWFPPGWWHHVKNLSFTISVTINFVSGHHFLPFEQQVRSTLLKPLLGLKKLKEEAILSTAKDLNNLEGIQFSPQNLIDSRYISLEKKYSNFLSNEAKRSNNIAQQLEQRC
jgi:hypothetical protein